MHPLRKYPRKFLWWMYFISFVVSLILDLLWLKLDTFDYHFSFQYILEFFAIFGLFGCMALIIISKWMGFFIVKDDGYYERQYKRHYESGEQK